jgi:hypothetical protein
LAQDWAQEKGGMELHRMRRPPNPGGMRSFQDH